MSDELEIHIKKNYEALYFGRNLSMKLKGFGKNYIGEDRIPLIRSEKLLLMYLWFKKLRKILESPIVEKKFKEKARDDWINILKTERIELKEVVSCTGKSEAEMLNLKTK